LTFAISAEFLCVFAVEDSKTFTAKVAKHPQGTTDLPGRDGCPAPLRGCPKLINLSFTCPKARPVCTPV